MAPAEWWDFAAPKGNRLRKERKDEIPVWGMLDDTGLAATAGLLPEGRRGGGASCS